MAKVFQENVFQNQKAGPVGLKVFQVEEAAGSGGARAVWLRRRRRAVKLKRTHRPL